MEREAEPAEDRRRLADAGGKVSRPRSPRRGRIRMAAPARCQRLEQVLVVARDAAPRAVAVADQGEDARGVMRQAQRRKPEPRPAGVPDAQTPRRAMRLRS